MRTTGIGSLAPSAEGAAALAGAPQEARAFDMDCKVILSMAGGFPSDCADAYGYMIDRITDVPPKPPFGFCAMTDGHGYADHDLEFARVSGRRAYRCPAGSRLRYHVERVQEDGTRCEVFCYTHTTTRGAQRGHDCERDEVTYHGRSRPQRINYRLRLTLAPGTASEWSSGLIEGNWRTGEIWRTGGTAEPLETTAPANQPPDTSTQP